VFTIPRRQTIRLISSRSYASEAAFDPSSVERATDEVDVCIVGGGPAGLSAAIRLKQLEQERGGDELRVVVLEKGGEVGTSYFTSYRRKRLMSRVTHLIGSRY
jgi:electron-transferring-flavoprotein dehydrogenase